MEATRSPGILGMPPPESVRARALANAGLSPGDLAAAATSVVLVALSGVAIASAPTEITMGHAQRVLYIHVAVAWCSLACFLAVAATGLGYLATRRLALDHWAHATAEVGWLCSWSTLATGSLWARSAWGAWWTWDPRLISAFVLWALYGGYVLLRASIPEPRTRARVSAILAIVGALDVPMVAMSTRWFRALHPRSPELEPSMRVAFVLTVLAFAWLVLFLVRCRRGQLVLQDRLRRLEATDDEEHDLR